MMSASGIFNDLDVEVTLDAPIGGMTWYGIGGKADVLLSPNSVEDLATLIKRCKRSRTPVRVLGRGANLLVVDDGVGGVVFRLNAPALKNIEFETTEDGPRLTVGAGADMAKTLMDCARRGLAGLEQMAGIPATIGGAIIMNAGGAFGTISDHLDSITTLSRGGELITYRKDELTFDYRHADIPDPIIVSATFAMTEADPIALRGRVKEIFAYKKSTQPLAEHSAGCSFKNPFDPEHEKIISAGKLIDEAGLKGTSVGGATVSQRHANFITVTAEARADDVLRLMELIRERVFDHAGIRLENEVIIWKRGETGTAL